MRLRTLPSSCANFKSGSLNLLEPSRPVQACNGIALLCFTSPSYGWFLTTAIALQNAHLLHHYLTFRKNINVSTRVAILCIIHYTSLNDIYFSLEYCVVEPKTAAVPSS